MFNSLRIDPADWSRGVQHKPPGGRLRKVAVCLSYLKEDESPFNGWRWVCGVKTCSSCSPVREYVVAGAEDPKLSKGDSKVGNDIKRRSSYLVTATASQAQRSCTTEALGRDSPSSKPRYSIDTAHLHLRTTYHWLHTQDFLRERMLSHNNLASIELTENQTRGENKVD